MFESAAQTYRANVLYGEFSDLHANEVVEQPLHYPETRLIAAQVSRHGGQLLEASPRRLYALFPKATEALACAEDLHALVHRVRESDAARGLLRFRLLLGHGLVTIAAGRMRSDWTFRLPGQAAQLPMNCIGVRPDFAQALGDAYRGRLQPLRGAREPLLIFGEPESDAGVTRIASALNLADAAFFSSLTLQVRSVAQTFRSSDCPILIGRDPQCSVPVGGETTSRRHGRIEFENGKFVYFDQSRNGTYILTQGGDEIFLLRESLVLVGAGAISPGATLAQQTGDVIRYTCEASRLAMSD